MLIGIDFDNTLVSYDEIFHSLALEQNLIDEDVAPNKASVRDHLKRKGREEEFTRLQGEVYGLHILKAKPFKGMKKALAILNEQNIRYVIISHKTKNPYKGPKYDLHKAAQSWLDKHKFTTKDGLNLTQNDIFFEETKQNKIKRCIELKCTHFIDDLPEILELLPNGVCKIWFKPKNPDCEYPFKNKNVAYMNHWNQLNDILKKN